jgi:hypothetical protein
MLTKRGNKVFRIVAICLLTVLVAGATAAIIYQMNGGSLADVGATIRGWFTLPPAA